MASPVRGRRWRSSRRCSPARLPRACPDQRRLRLRRPIGWAAAYACGGPGRRCAGEADAAGADRFHVAGHNRGGRGGVVPRRPLPQAPVQCRWLVDPRTLERRPSRCCAVCSRCAPGTCWRSSSPPSPCGYSSRPGGRSLRAALVSSGLPAELADRYVARMLEPGALTDALHWVPRRVPSPGRPPLDRHRRVARGRSWHDLTRTVGGWPRACERGGWRAPS